MPAFERERAMVGAPSGVLPLRQLSIHEKDGARLYEGTMLGGFMLLLLLLPSHGSIEDAIETASLPTSGGGGT